jgi:Lrp/AsnC family leucine-responsive transcriptional regulator
MDHIQTNIIRILLKDGHISNAALAKRVGLSESATLERVRRLERSGVIQGYTARVEPKSVGRGLEVHMTFILKNQGPGDVKRFEEAMASFDEVLGCAQLLGRFDFIAHVAVRDVEALQRFLDVKLLPLGEFIDRMESLTVLKTIKRFHPPLPLEGDDQ